MLLEWAFDRDTSSQEDVEVAHSGLFSNQKRSGLSTNTNGSHNDCFGSTTYFFRWTWTAMAASLTKQA